MNRSKIICTLLVMCFVFVLVAGGCGPEANRDTSETGKSVETTGSQATTAAADTVKPKKDVTLTMWTWKTAQVPGLVAAATEFEKKTGIKIKVESTAGDDAYKAKVTSAANASNAADIIQYWAAIHDIENGFVELLNSGIIDPEWKSKFVKQAFNMNTVKEVQYTEWQSKPDVSTVKKSLKVGDCYGMPLEIGGNFTFYGNIKIIEQAGLKAEAPKTWEDFIAMMKTIKEKTGTAGLVLGEGIPDLWYNWAGTALEVMMNGPEGYRAIMLRQEKMSEPGHLAVVKAFESLVKENLLLPGCAVIKIDAADQAFAGDQAAFVLGGSFTLPNLAAMGRDPKEFIMFPVPPLNGSKITEWKQTPVTLTTIMLSKNAKDQEAALDFMKYLTSNEGALLYGNNAFCVPAIDLGEDAAKLVPELLQITKAYVSDGEAPLDKVTDVYPQKYWDNGEWRRFDSRVQRMISGKYTAEQTAKDFDDRMAELSAPAPAAN